MVARLASLVVVLGILSCSPPSPDRVCAPGATQACLGFAGPCSGVQSCALDGMSWQPCVCSGPAGGGGGSGGSDAGVMGDGGVSDAGPADYAVTPAALSFEACPSRTSGGAAIADVFPDLEQVIIFNQASTSRGLEVRLLGNDAGSFALPTPAPTTTGPMTSTALQIAFSPHVAGQSQAALSIGVPGGAVTTVVLVGSSLALPSMPVLETAPQRGDLSGFTTCTTESPLSDCTLEFPDTPIGQSKTLQLKLRNRGCPSLKVTSVTIEGASHPGTADGFTLASPAVGPTQSDPLVLQVADGTSERTLTLRFTATDDGSGMAVQDHYAVITFISNDPLVGDGVTNPARLTLVARAIR